MAGRGEAVMKSLSPREYMDSAARSGLVFQPEVHHPAFGLAMLQHLVRGGGLYADDDFSGGALGRHFPDSYNWGHFANFLGYFKFGVKPILVEVLLAGLTTFLLTLRALGGTEFAFRIWNAIFESVLGTAEVEFPSGSEPVAVLKLKQGEEAQSGWDAFFPNYHLHVMRVLEGSVDRGRADRLVQLASATPVGHTLRVAADGLIRLVYEQGSDASVRAGFGDVVTGGMLGEVARSNPHLLDANPLGVTQSATAALFGDAGGNNTVINPNSAGAWAATMRRLLVSPAGRAGTFPVSGQGLASLDGLSAIHRYGSERTNADGSTSKHLGLDLPAPSGAPVVATHAGRVISAKSGWKREDFDNKAPGWSRGNYVIVETPASGGAVARTGYYHLADLAKGLKVGDQVQAGQQLGTVGSTGNSSGPHLHLESHWVIPTSDTGKPARSWALDPETVIRRGYAEAARTAGADLGVPGKPILAGLTWALGGVASPSFALPARAAGLADLPAMGGILDTINNAAKKANDAIVKSARNGVLGAALKAGFGVMGLPASASDGFTAVIERAWNAAKKTGGDPVATVKAALQGVNAPENVINGAVTIVSQQGIFAPPAIGNVEGGEEDDGDDWGSSEDYDDDGDEG